MRLFIIFLVGFAIFRFLDIYQTAYIIQTSGMDEQNPLALYLFQEHGLAGIVSFSIIGTMVFILGLSYVYFRYSGTENEMYAKNISRSLAGAACIITGLVMIQWAQYHEAANAGDISNVTVASENYINTNTQPIPQIAFSSMHKTQRHPVKVPQLGSPKNFKYMTGLMDLSKVRVEYWHHEHGKVQYADARSKF